MHLKSKRKYFKKLFIKSFNRRRLIGISAKNNFKVVKDIIK